MPPPPVKIFCSYAHKDKRQREALGAHFALLQREGFATFWSDHEIYAGSDWAGEIDEHLRTANVILLLLSANFISSDYCYNVELKCAAERHLAREAVVIPVILQPCEWHLVRVKCEGGEFALGGVQALPPSALPVTRWRKQQEAYNKIAEGVRAVLGQLSDGAATWGETTVALPPRPAAPGAPVPELLPYLCDRTPQERLLGDAVKSWRAGRRTKRPLVCVVHGDDDEAIDMFRRRLHEFTLPELLAARADPSDEQLYDAAAGTLEDLFIPLPSSFDAPETAFDFLQPDVGRLLINNMYATPEAVAGAVSAKRTPTLFHSNLSSGDWDPDGERIVDAYLNFWGSLPDVKAGRALCFLFFNYTAAAAGRSARLDSLNARAEGFFGGLPARLEKYAGVHALVLPKLPPVKRSEVVTCVRHGENFRKVRLCRAHPHGFCNVEKAVEEIGRSVCPDPLTPIPMGKLAPQLYKVIKNYRCDAAGLA